MQEILRKALADSVDAAKCPGAVAFVGLRNETVFHEAYGYRQTVPEKKDAERDTIYDLASLTKVIATTTAVLLLREDGLIDIDRPVSEYLPIPVFSHITIRHLLTHTSGLTAGRPYYNETSSLTEMIQRYAERGSDWAPWTRRRYSDAGFMILGRVVELVAQDRLDSFCVRRIFRPIGMTSTGFRPPAEWIERCAATELCPWRKKVLVGEVHDENAYAVGGVAGHAGLFSTAQDIARFCRALLAGELLKPSTIDEMTRLGGVPFYPWQGLGWQLDPWSTGVDGFLPSRAAFGHSGWTGVCLWIDRATGLFAILLGNTCHPSRARRNNEEFRRTFFNAVAELFYPHTTSTHTGLDRLMRADFEPLRGKRIALLTHRAAVDQLGRSILDVLPFASDVSVRILYSPEHGIRGQAEAGAAVPSERGPTPVISLMGKRTAPSPAELEQIDCFVVDLQDIGARYYTYAATMKTCIEACRTAGKTVVVLDRPNPVGGQTLEGPIAQRDDSPVCWGKVPVRHGMTLGELGEWFAATGAGNKPANVTVLPLDNWQRKRFWGECSLPWIPPSPNIPCPDTALAYVGTCLFEGVNVNEGRGTDTPFLVFGAPWAAPDRLIDFLTPEDRVGCELAPFEYVPHSVPGKASRPRYRDETCRGIRIQVTDRSRFRPFRLVVALLTAFRHIHAGQFTWDTAQTFDTLAGTDELRVRIDRGENAATILAVLEAGLSQFAETAPRRYL